MPVPRPKTARQHAYKATAKAIVRAVASSTAIETGQSVRHTERVLREKRSKYAKLALAN